MSTFRCHSPVPHLVLGIRPDATVAEIERAYLIHGMGHHLDELGITSIEDVGAQVFLIKRCYEALMEAATTGRPVASMRQEDAESTCDDSNKAGNDIIMACGDADSDTVVEMKEEDPSPSKQDLSQYPEYKAANDHTAARDVVGTTEDDNSAGDLGVAGSRFVRNRNKSKSNRTWRGPRFGGGAGRQGDQRSAGWDRGFDSNVGPSLPRPAPRWTRNTYRGWKHGSERQSNQRSSSSYWRSDRYTPY